MNKDTGEHTFGPTASEIFNKVKEHLLRQGRPSTDDIACRYRSPDGLKCAVGCLITDEAYDYNIEGKGVGNCSVIEALNKSGIDGKFHSKLLKKLQDIHDYTKAEKWESMLERVKP